jgi:hypothetical protein
MRFCALIILINLLVCNLYAAGPIYIHRDKIVQREFQELYQEVDKQLKVAQIYPRTLAEINLLYPSAAGQLVFCSNCTNTVICVSTGTGRGAFSSPSAKTTHCN